MITYFDSSALVKNYIEEADSELVRDLLANTIPATTRLSGAEVASAVTRRCREGDLSEDDRDQILADLNADLAGLYIVELAPEVISVAQDLLLKRSLRAADSVQLSSCLVLQRSLGQPVRFAVYDHRLVEAARLEGLAIAKG